METNPDLRRTSPTGLRLAAVALLLPLLLHLCIVRVQAQIVWSYHSVLTNPSSSGIGFGSSISASPDGNWVAVGARDDTANGQSSAGSLKMYKRGSSGGWDLSATLVAASPLANANLGSSVAITNDRVIGAANMDNSSAGRLTPFVLVGPNWAREAELVGPAESQLGDSLATDGTYLVAGGNSYSSNKGVVIVYTISGSYAWAPMVTLVGSVDGGRIGFPVTVGSNLIVAGAGGELNMQGAVYVWSISSGTVSSTPSRLTTPTALSNYSFFGGAVTIFSSTKFAAGCDAKSSVYVYTFTSGAWSLYSTVAAPPNVNSFGIKVSYSQNYLLVGCSGKALLYSVTGDSISSSYVDLVPTGVSVSNQYGYSPLTMASMRAFVVEYNTVNFPYVYRVFIFKGAAPTLSSSRSRSRSKSRSRSRSRSQSRSQSQTQSQSQSLSPDVESVVPNKKSKSKALGYKVAFWDDNAIISVPFCFDTSKSCDGGYILLFQKNSISSKWLFNTKVRNPFRNRDNKFGYNIYVRDNYLFVSAPDSQYVGASTLTIVVYKWNPATNTYEKDSFIRYRKADKVYALGAAISNFGAITAIGTSDYDKSDVLTNAGGVHAYKKKDTGKWGERKTITAPTPQADEHFGQSVSLQSETRIAISNKPADASLQAVYIFDFDEGEWTWAQTISDGIKAGFGWNIKFFDDLLYISAASGAGSITVYEADSDEMYAVSYTFQPKTAVTDGRFGFSFATDGTRFVVGTQPCDDGAVCGTKGSAYTFTKDSSNQWAEQYRYALGAADGSDGFGFDVAISGDTVLVSAPFKAVNTRDGVAYFITK